MSADGGITDFGSSVADYMHNPGTIRPRHCEKCGPGPDEYLIAENRTCGLTVLLCYPHIRDWENALLADPKKRAYELLRLKMNAAINGEMMHGTIEALDAQGNEYEDHFTGKLRAWLADVNPITEAP